jgi:hypothetical protein
MKKDSPDIAALRKELAELWRTLRRLRADRRSQLTAKHRIAQAWRDGWRICNMGGEAGVHKTNSAIALLPPVTQKEAAEMLAFPRKLTFALCRR